MATENFANDGQTYLTGVVIDDHDGDDFYDIGEGQGDVRVTIWNDENTYATSTWASGGYSVAVDSGTYNVRFEGGDLENAYETTVTVGGQNEKLDIIEDEIVPETSTSTMVAGLEDDDPISSLFLAASDAAEALHEAADVMHSSEDQFEEDFFAIF